MSKLIENLFALYIVIVIVIAAITEATRQIAHAIAIYWPVLLFFVVLGFAVFITYKYWELRKVRDDEIADQWNAPQRFVNPYGNYVGRRVDEVEWQ